MDWPPMPPRMASRSEMQTPMAPWAVCAVLVCWLVASVSADLDYSRVHIVDYNFDGIGAVVGGAVRSLPQNNALFLAGHVQKFLFRSNTPTNSSSFAYDSLLAMMRERAQVVGTRCCRCDALDLTRVACAALVSGGQHEPAC